MADSIHPWPISLPKPLVDGFSDGGDDGVLRSQFDAGPSKIRPKYTGKPTDSIGLKLMLSKAQKQTLDDFYWVTLNRVRLFYFPDYTRPLEDQANIAIHRFSARPTFEANQVGWLFVATLQFERMTQVQGHFLLDVSNGTQGLST